MCLILKGVGIRKQISPYLYFLFLVIFCSLKEGFFDLILIEVKFDFLKQNKKLFNPLINYLRQMWWNTFFCTFSDPKINFGVLVIFKIIKLSFFLPSAFFALATPRKGVNFLAPTLRSWLHRTKLKKPKICGKRRILSSQLLI